MDDLSFGFLPSKQVERYESDHRLCIHHPLGLTLSTHCEILVDRHIDSDISKFETHPDSVSLDELIRTRSPLSD
jgi:hypothetical protein